MAHVQIDVRDAPAYEAMLQQIDHVFRKQIFRLIPDEVVHQTRFLVQIGQRNQI